MEVLERYSRQGSLALQLRSLRDITDGSPQRSAATASPSPRTHKLAARVDGELIARIVAEYEAGVPSTQLAQECGLSKTSVVKLLREAGVKIRRQSLAPTQTEEAVRLYQGGLSLSKVGEHLGCDPSTVHAALKQAGVRTRDSHGRER